MIALGFRLMTWLAALCVAMPAMAQQANHITATLVAESLEPAAGATTTLALVMEPDPTWHGYWKNPGDSGLETQVLWSLPEGVSAGELAYPVPHRLLIAGLMNYVYDTKYAHLITLRIPAGLVAGTPLPIRARAKWLACTKEICVPEQADVAIDLTIGRGRPDAARRPDFAAWRAALPLPLGSPTHFEAGADRFRLAVPLPAGAALKEPWFYPLTDGAIDYAAPQMISRAGDMVIVEVKAAQGAGALATVDGVLRIDEGRGLSLSATKGIVPPAGAPVTTDAAGVGEGGSLASIVAALGGALLGGLLLNIMPCVFPILSLKALSLVRGESERTARRDALAYAGGAILVCMLLGGALLALRASGSAAGWAFQLQDPRVIIVLLLLVTGIALNLAGLFALPSIGVGGGLAGRSGRSGAFWTGALAAFVATPCTGPFMGAALGAALILPPLAAMAVFIGLGLGLALPFLLLGFVPSLRRRLPRPGPWMETFRHILSVPMFLTALGLVWLSGRLAGVDGMGLALGAALLLGGALWWVGQRQAHGRARSWWPLIPALAGGIALIAIVPRAPAAAMQSSSVPGAERFSEARLAALRAEGRPVFVYFTADWCLTCKVNERAAIERAQVMDAFRSKNIAVLVGDWTSGDAAITRFLASHGRSGVPLYLFYRPGADVEILPQILTPGMLTALAA